MSNRLSNAITHHSFDEEEQNIINQHFKQLRSWISNSLVTFELNVPSTLYSIYHYSTTSLLATNEVVRFLDSMESGEKATLFSSEFSTLLDRLVIELISNRILPIITKINTKESLTHSTLKEDFISSTEDTRLSKLYTNTSEKLNIDFTVQLLPFPFEVLDPRIVTIPSGKNNENHKHAHETIFIFIKGVGHVMIDGIKIDVKPGDLVFVPRWSMHQSTNSGECEMKILAIADFGLTGKSFIGNYLKTARLKH